METFLEVSWIYRLEHHAFKKLYPDSHSHGILSERGEGSERSGEFHKLFTLEKVTSSFVYASRTTTTNQVQFFFLAYKS